MISIKSIHCARHLFRGIELRGHAKFANSGQDIVCAAVSVLVENLAKSLETLLEVPLNIEDKKELYKITLDSDNVSKETELLFASVFLGLSTLARQYPDCIELKEIHYGT